MEIKVRRFSTLCRIGGLGYRGLSTITHKRSKTTNRRFGIRLSCHWNGGLVEAHLFILIFEESWFREETKGSHPEHLFSQPGMRDFQEFIRRWMMKWLDAVRWYSLSAIQPVVSIEIEQAPVVQTHWNLVRKDESLFRFGGSIEYWDIFLSRYTASR